MTAPTSVAILCDAGCENARAIVPSIGRATHGCLAHPILAQALVVFTVIVKALVRSIGGGLVIVARKELGNRVMGNRESRDG
jgi:hypothetical protein